MQPHIAGNVKQEILRWYRALRWSRQLQLSSPEDHLLTLHSRLISSLSLSEQTIKLTHLKSEIPLHWTVSAVLRFPSQEEWRHLKLTISL